MGNCHTSLCNLDSRAIRLSLGDDMKPAIVTGAAGASHIGLKSENQDDFAIIDPFVDSKLGSVYAVWDGHGTNGLLVSRFCKKRLPELLAAEVMRCRQNDRPNDRLCIENALQQSFIKTDADCRKSGIDCSGSGSTSTVALVYGNELFVAAAGDSRAVAGIIDEYSEERVVAEPLSIDHRLNRDSEIGRVTLAGGRVEPSRSFNGAFRGSDRLWLRHLQVPGLMVSRSIGDEVARQVGCISTPEIMRKVIDANVKFIVLATDGVWDVLDNQFVVDMVNSIPDPAEACNAVIQAAMLRWEDKYSADNITVVVVRFHADSSRPP